jgi:hypothetical protein
MSHASNSSSPFLTSPVTDKPLKTPKLQEKLSSATTIAMRQCREAAQKLPACVSSYFFEKAHSLISMVIENQKKSDSLLQLQKDDYVPRSLKSALTLSGSNEVSRTTEFSTLATSLHTTTATFVKSAKAIMVESALLERNRRLTHIVETFFTVCKIIIQFYIVEMGTPINQDDCATVDQDLVYVLLTDYLLDSQDFCNKVVLLSTDLPSIEIVHIRNKMFPMAETVHFQELRQNTQVHKQFLENVDNLLTELIFQPIQKYNQQLSLLTKDKLRREFITNLKADEKAKDTVMTMADEHTVSPKILRSLINQEVNKELRKLQISKKNVNKNSMDVNNKIQKNKPKNISRGAKKGQSHPQNTANKTSAPQRASLKKKSHVTRTTTLTNGQQPLQNSTGSTKQKKVADKGNAGRNVNTTKKKNSSKKQYKKIAK